MQAGGIRTARGLAQALNERGFSVSERTVTGWRNRESAIPAWALVAFGQVSGLGLDALMGVEDAATLVTRVTNLERVVGETQAMVIELCERMGVPWRPIQPVQDQERATGLG